MPLLRSAASDVTAYIKAAAQYIPTGGRGKPAPIVGLGAVVRTSLVGIRMSPSSTTLVIPSIIPVAVPVAAVVTLANSGTQE